MRKDLLKQYIYKQGWFGCNGCALSFQVTRWLFLINGHRHITATASSKCTIFGFKKLAISVTHQQKFLLFLLFLHNTFDIFDGNLSLL